jgi:hypothetical protein
MSSLDIWKDYSLFKFREWLEVLLNTFIVSSFLQVAALSLMVGYFFITLNMADKIFAFIISGKIVGTNYTLDFEQICIISAVIVSFMLAASIYSLVKERRSRGKIKLSYNKAEPLNLTVNIISSFA